MRAELEQNLNYLLLQGGFMKKIVIIIMAFTWASSSWAEQLCIDKNEQAVTNKVKTMLQNQKVWQTVEKGARVADKANNFVLNVNYADISSSQILLNGSNVTGEIKSLCVNGSTIVIRTDSKRAPVAVMNVTAGRIIMRTPLQLELVPKNLVVSELLTPNQFQPPSTVAF